MSNVNISLKKEAYEFLKALKSRNKSFSDVVLEFKEKNNTSRNGKALLKYAGALNSLNIDWEAKERGMKGFRDSFNKRIVETKRKMEKLRNDRN